MLLWGTFYDLFDEELVQTIVCSQFGVEGGGELMALPNTDDVSIHDREDFNLGGKCTMDVGSTDKGHGEIGSHPC